MDAKDAFHCTSALLRDYLERFDMCTSRGPLRALGDLVSGILWTGSVQLTNAARLLADTPPRLAHEADRLSLQLENRHWDHRDVKWGNSNTKHIPFQAAKMTGRALLKKPCNVFWSNP